jgi:hypothetical protein
MKVEFDNENCIGICPEHFVDRNRMQRPMGQRRAGGLAGTYANGT